ncbi:MAG: DUF3494 domain-containing protein [Desulfuromonadales bacterium]|nr:DUF3494 domain-containing protein [Desulfuromonadales bacterium]
MQRLKMIKAFLLSTLTLAVFILPGCGGGGEGGGGHWDKPPGVAFTVTPATASIPAGSSQLFTATVTYANGTTENVTADATWVSDTPGVAAFLTTPGVAAGVTGGVAGLTATFGTQTATATLTVNDAVLVSIVVTPATASIPVGSSQQYTAMATYSFGPDVDVTDTATWTSANVPVGGTPVATLSTNFLPGAGDATGDVSGIAGITATFGAQTATATLTVNAAVLESITVTPATPSIPAGGIQQFIAMANYSFGPSVNVTENIGTIWTSTNVPTGGAAVATMSQNGVPGAGSATGNIGGIATITAIFGTQSGTATLTVNDAVLESITVTPATATVPAGESQQFTAMATYSFGPDVNVTQTAIWTTANVPVGGTLVATMSENLLPGAGRATGEVGGTSAITATFGAQSGTATLTVNEAVLVSILVTPEIASIPVGESQQFTAMATYSFGPDVDVTETATWTSANLPTGGTLVATLSQNLLPGAGNATGEVGGIAEITATLGTQSDTATLEVMVASIIPGAFCPAESGPTIPTVTLSDPTDGNLAATTSTNAVANGGKLITATFSMAMDPLTIDDLSFTLTPDGGTTLIPVSVLYDDFTMVATLTTAVALEPGTPYTAIITRDVTSAAGVALACPYEWTFTTVTPAATGQMGVPLGSAANFVILASAGITNIPTSAITGDVGLTPDAGSNISGFVEPLSCPEVTGTIWAVDATGPACAEIDPVRLTNAKTDAAAAFLYARAAVRGTPASISGNLNGLTLYPGLYESLSTIEISAGGFLTLDGQGDGNAVFIIRSETSITTEDQSRVILSGGAKAANVFWTAGSAVTLGTNSIMQGTMIAGTSISLLTGATLEGRALNQGAAAEAITLDRATITLPLP